MCNLNNNNNKKKSKKLVDTENRLVFTGGEEWEVKKWVKRVKMYKFPVINKSWVCNM